MKTTVITIAKGELASFEFITPCGYDRHSICREHYDDARGVLQGVLDDPAFCAFISAAGDEADGTEPEVWRAGRQPEFRRDDRRGAVRRGLP